MLDIILISSIILSVIIQAILRLFFKKSKDVFRFKITNFYKTFAFGLLHILLFFGVFYFLRLYNLGNYIDFKLTAKSLFELYQKLIVLPRVTILLIFITAILSFLIFLLLFIIIYKYLLIELLKIFRYFINKYPEYILKYLLKINIKRSILYHPIVIIPYKILEYFIRYPKYPTQEEIAFMASQIKNHSGLYTQSQIEHITRTILVKNPVNYPFWVAIIRRIKFYLLYKEDKINLIFLFSPLIFMLIECILNDFSLKYVFYYMLLFIPIATLSRYFEYFITREESVLIMLGNLYYNEKKDIIICIPYEYNKAFELYLMQDLSRYAIKYSVEDVDSVLEMQYFFKEQGNITFELFTYLYTPQVDPELESYRIEKLEHYKNLTKENGIFYENSMGVILRKDGGHVFEDIEDYDGNFEKTKEWRLILQK